MVERNREKLRETEISNPNNVHPNERGYMSEYIYCRLVLEHL